MQAQSPQLEITASRQLTSWLNEQYLSLAFSTYQAGKLFFVGLYVQGSSLYMSSLYQLWRFENALEPGQTSNGYDALYVPQVGYITWDLDIHDIAYINNSTAATFPDGLVFVNTFV